MLQSSTILKSSFSGEDHSSERKINCQDDMYTMKNRSRRFQSSTINSHSISAEDLRSKTPINLSTDDHNLLISTSKSSSVNDSFSSYSSLSSVSSADSSINSNDQHLGNKPETQSFLSSSGYDSSLNSIPDHLFPSSIDSIIIPDCHLVEKFINLNIDNQTSVESNIDSFFSLPSSAPIISSPVYRRKCINHNQISSDTDDDSQSTIVPTNILPLQQQNKRPRSLPIAIQQTKCVSNQKNDGDDDDDDDDDNEENSNSQTFSSCNCSMNSSQRKRFRKSEISTATSACVTYSENNLTKLSNDKSHTDEQTNFNQNQSIEHFIMSPTDKVKIQMKYHENDTNNELTLSKPEDIDFKRSKLKAIRTLYQNRFKINNSQHPVSHRYSNIVKTRTAENCDPTIEKRIVNNTTIHNNNNNNPRLFRTVLSCSVLEADDEHEVVSSTARSAINRTREKAHIQTFHSLRVNFIESLLNGKILPCGIIDGFTIKLGASGLFLPKQVVLPMTTFWFNISEHQAASPYLGFINLQSLPKRGYHTPTKGTITLALLNPNGTVVHLFLILYDLSDMPPDHRTFIRQRIILMPENIIDNNINKQSSLVTSNDSLRYLAHIRFVTSQTGKLYMHSDIRVIFARNKIDYDERTGTGKPQLVTVTDMPTPKYWSRK